MIHTEIVTIRGRQFRRTYSGTHMILRDGVEYGVEYEEALDPVDTDRVYDESTTLLPNEEATDEDYQAALAELGVSV